MNLRIPMTMILRTCLPVLLILLFLAGCTPRHVPPRPAAPDSLAESVIQTARSQIGTPYRRSGTRPGIGFDCSGLVQWVYGFHGLTLPRTSTEMMKVGVAVPKQELQAGDLVIFRIGRRGIMHVGIATGQGTFIHSPRPGQSVREDNLYAPYWTQRKISVRRVL